MSLITLTLLKDPLEMNHMFSSGSLGRQQKKADPPVQDTYKFNCYVAGDDTTFPILVPSTADVGQLIKRVYEGGELDKLKFRIMEMRFWKVCQDWRTV